MSSQSPSSPPSFSVPSSFQVIFSFQGKSFYATVPGTPTSGAELHKLAREALQQLTCHDPTITTSSRNGDSGNDNVDYSTAELKLLYKGKRIADDDDVPVVLLAQDNNNNNHYKTKPPGPPKIMVMATTNSIIRDVQTKRSDPTIRGLDQQIAIERQQQQGKNGPQQQQQQQQMHWGEGMVQSKDFKFCRFEACTWQSFGHRPTDQQTPHAFQAMQLLEKLATDPGIVAIMEERELVVGTLGEMDPIDDRLMLEKQHGGSCLLGYNTNAGTRIDLKLRTDDLRGFRPYPQLAATLIHELSHNWVGDHNLLFWTNYAQMRAEYLHTHAVLRSTIVRGRTTAELAGLDGARLDDVYTCIVQELIPEMAQHHGLHPRMIEAPIRQRIGELEETHKRGRRLGGGDSSNVKADNHNGKDDARERALAAAERRAREQQHHQQKKDDSNNKR